MSESKQRIVIDVTGRVQGVFFRHNTTKRARKWNLKGYVENRPDGSVHIEAEGPKDKLERLLEFAKEGPRLARVDNVEYDYKEPKGEYEQHYYKF
jgi:acylphosphatase